MDFSGGRAYLIGVGTSIPNPFLLPNGTNIRSARGRDSGA